MTSWSPPSDPEELEAFRQSVFDRAIELRDQRLAKMALRQAARERAAAKRVAVALRKQRREEDARERRERDEARRRERRERGWNERVVLEAGVAERLTSAPPL
jgi:hypothetical protein